MSDPTFLLCTERCGSNLIRAMLDAHPEIYAPMPVHLASWWANRVWRFGDVRDTANWRRMLVATVAFVDKARGDLGVKVTADELERECPDRRFGSVYAYVYAKGRDHFGKRLIFVKENHTYQRLPLLLAQFPAARFVYQVRDPRDYVASCKSAGHYRDLIHATELWREEQLRSVAVLHGIGMDRVFCQRYEDLIADPERVLAALCEFLGTRFEPAMLEFYRTEAAAAAASRNARYWKNLTRPTQRDNAGKYRQALSGWQLELIEHRVGELMDFLRYPREFERIGRFAAWLSKRTDYACVHRPAGPTPLLHSLTARINGFADDTAEPPGRPPSPATAARPQAPASPALAPLEFGYGVF